MNSILLIDAKNFSDFIERFFINAITPPILILMIIFIVKFKRVDIKASKSFCYILFFYVIADLFLRLYYTFILNMENQTRYFMIQTIFYLIPAAAVCQFIVDQPKVDQRKATAIFCIVIFIYGAIESLKPEWNKPELEEFAKIVAEDSSRYKWVEEIKIEDNGSYKVNNDYRPIYYAGIWRGEEGRSKAYGEKGAMYFIIKKRLDKLGNFSLKLVAEAEDRKGRKKYLYKVSLNK